MIGKSGVGLLTNSIVFMSHLWDNLSYSLTR